MYLTDQIPELKTEPYRIAFHITGELLTAVLLIMAGVAVLTSLSWALPVYLVAIGMLIYTVIVSPGYFAQKRQWAWVVMFAVLLILAVVSSAVVWNASAGG